MNINIVDTEFRLILYGISGIATNKDYAGTAFRLMDKMWQIVKSNQLKNKGINVWVYDDSNQVFAGVELYEAPDATLGLELKQIQLAKYARYKHVGPYQSIPSAGRRVNEELRTRGFSPGLPYIEIYGHPAPDESKQETELLINLL